MDDGSKTWNGYVRLAVTPNKEDPALLLKLLGQLGLNPRYHENRDGSDSSIWVHDRSALSKFIDLISPHVPDCMSYKLDLVPRSRGMAPRHRLTPELLSPLVQQGWGANRISSALNASVGSVRRALDRAGVVRTSGRPRTKETVDWAEAKAFSQTPGLSDEDLVQCYLRLPQPGAPSVAEVERDWALLKAASPVIEGGRIQASGVGQKASSLFFPYRYEARYRGLPSLNEAWFDAAWVSKALAF